MPFANITRLAMARVASINYFVDANVWIYAIQGEELLDRWQKPYSNFFYNIIESSLDPQPKILMPTLLFSEILNTYLTKFALAEYKAIEGIPVSGSTFQFKRDYRPSQHYKDSYEKVIDDILSFKNSLHFIDDKSIVTDPPLYLSPAVDPFDFNDYFYYQICKEFQKLDTVTILTNDGDFQINDIPIITLNRTLLAL